MLNLIAMRRVLRRNAPKLLPNLWKTTIAAVLMGGATWLAYWGLGRIGMGRAVACLGSIVVAVLVYVVLIIVLKVLTYEDCLLLPKGEKIAKFCAFADFFQKKPCVFARHVVDFISMRSGISPENDILRKEDTHYEQD